MRSEEAPLKRNDMVFKVSLKNPPLAFDARGILLRLQRLDLAAGEAAASWSKIVASLPVTGSKLSLSSSGEIVPLTQKPPRRISGTPIPSESSTIASPESGLSETTGGRDIETTSTESVPPTKATIPSPSGLTAGDGKNLEKQLARFTLNIKLALPSGAPIPKISALENGQDLSRAITTLRYPQSRDCKKCYTKRDPKMPKQANKATAAERQRQNNGKFGKGNPHRFKPGISGNPAGRPKFRTLSESLRAFLEQPIDKRKGSPTLAEEIAEAILKKARKGDVKAFIAIADRVEGKPAQKVELTEKLDMSVEIVIARVMRDGNCDRITAMKVVSEYIPSVRRLVESAAVQNEH